MTRGVDFPQSLFAELEPQNYEVLDPWPPGLQTNLPVFAAGLHWGVEMLTHQQELSVLPLAALTLETARLGMPDVQDQKPPVLPFPQRHLHFPHCIHLINRLANVCGLDAVVARTEAARVRSCSR